MASSLTKCGSCRYALIDAFMATAGLSIRPVARPGHFTARTQRFHTHKPALSNSVPSDVESYSPLGTAPDIDQTLPGEKQQVEVSDRNGPDESTSIPWYLQVQTPKRDTSPLVKHQQLPKLPPEPPPLLKPMLEHISTDIGLDDLTLFDLRDIDPPPALGANLIMVLGTARSEKHLHVSADRFCRWLKTTHHLSPYADGLIGRGELKLKLKRKARRARLLSNVGSSERSSVDDGIRTGWICVTVGNVPDGRNDMVHKDLHDDYVGFGGEVDGAKVVIQMLTQEKREELDLEDLWGKMVRRQERKEARISPKKDVQSSTHEVGSQTHLEKRVMSGSYLHLSSMARTSLGPYSQTRSSHTSAAASTMTKVQHHQSKAPVEFFRARLLNKGDDMRKPPLEYFEDQDLSIEQNFTNILKKKVSFSSKAERFAALQDLIDHLKEMPHAEAREFLNEKSSPFWKSFDDIYPLFPSIEDCELYLHVLSYAQEIGIDSAKNSVIQLQDDMERSFLDIPESIYLTTIKAILQQPVSPSNLLKAATILEHMSARGHSIAKEEIRTLVQFATLQVSAPSNDLKLRGDAFQRLKRLMNRLLGPAPVEAEINLMNACAAADNWEAFWDVWRGFARAIRPRPRELYITMFRCTAQREHQAEAMKCLRECVPEMALEEPPVTMDADIAKAVKSCLFVAEPEIGKIAANNDAFGEWASLWRRCNRATLASAENKSSKTRNAG